MRVPLVSNSVVRVSGRVGVFGLLFSASAHAASINWGSVQNISGPGTTTVSTTKTQGGPGGNVTITNGTNDVNKQGTQVLGVNFSGQPGSTFPYTTTIGGQNFYSFVDLPGPSGSPPFPVTISTPDMTNGYVGYTPGTAGQSYGYSNSGGVGPNPDYTLANAIFSNTTTGTIILGNLTQGDKYLLQFWVSDPRNSTTQTRVETLNSSTGGDTNIPTLDYEAPGSTDGQWVTGTFVADSTITETLDLSASNSNPSSGDSGSPQVNLLQLRDITSVPAPQWISAASGDWNNVANWSTVVPNGVGATADFFSAITSNHTVYTDAPITVGTINFNNANTYQITGTGSLTLQASAGNAQVIVQQGTQEINLPTTIASNTTFNVSSGATLVIGNPLTINSGQTLTPAGTGTITYNSIVNVLGGAAIAFGNSTHANALNLSSGAKASVTGGSTSVVEVDNLSNAGTIDIQNGELLVNYGSGTDPFSTVEAEAKSGYAGGAWTGTGINSSHAAASGGHYGVGVVDSAANVVVGLVGGKVEVKFALYGDITLGGVVNGTDFGILAANFGKNVTGGWEQGDFTYAGKVNATDFGLLAANFGKTASGSAIALPAADWAALDSFAAANGLTSALPEPASVGLLVAGTVAALARRRRRAL